MLKINLQFFAEDTGAEDSVMEAFGAGLLSDDDDFEGFGETGEMGAEDVPQEPEEETAPEGGGDAEGGAGGETQETPAEEPAAGGAETEATGGMTVEVGGVMVPAEAMQALSGALGQDASELIRRGMAYEQKGARELAILEDYARSRGMNMSQFLDELEQQRDEYLISEEIESIRGRFPEGTPDEALHEIASNAVQTRRAQERAAQAMQQHAAAQRQEQARVQSIRDEISRFKAAHPEFPTAADVPQPVWDAIEASGGKIGLDTAFAMYERDQAKAENESLREQLQAEKKNNQNRAQSTGSQMGAGDAADPFLAGLFSDD